MAHNRLDRLRDGARHAHLHAGCRLGCGLSGRVRQAGQGRRHHSLRCRCPGLGALHRYGPLWLCLVCRGHGLGPFDGLGRPSPGASDAADRHAHHRGGNPRRSALYPLGRIWPGRHQVAGRLQDRASLCLRPHRHRHRPCHRPRHRRDRGGALHHGSGHQPAYFAARFRSSHDRSPVSARQ